MPHQDSSLDEILQRAQEHNQLFVLFMENVARFFEIHPDLSNRTPPVIHSVKMRIKDESHLREKVERMRDGPTPVTKENVFKTVTDIAGVRVLHLYQKQLANIHSAINRQVEAGEWVFDENPKAYSWDPDASEFFRSLGLGVEIKESHYTSVHYLVRPRSDAPVCCEIQVRTLLEEVWGEIDHIVNYPTGTDSVAIYEQLRVLAKLVATGSRLADGIFKVKEAEMQHRRTS